MRIRPRVFMPPSEDRLLHIWRETKLIILDIPQEKHLNGHQGRQAMQSPRWEIRNNGSAVFPGLKVLVLLALPLPPPPRKVHKPKSIGMVTQFQGRRFAQPAQASDSPAALGN